MTSWIGPNTSIDIINIQCNFQGKKVIARSKDLKLLYFSSNYGIDWPISVSSNDINQFNDQYIITFCINSNASKIYVQIDNYIYTSDINWLSDPISFSWSELSILDPLYSSGAAMICMNNIIINTGTNTNVLHLSTNSGVNWSIVSIPTLSNGNEYFYSITSSYNGDFIIMSGFSLTTNNSRIYISTDYGASFIYKYTVQNSDLKLTCSSTGQYIYATYNNLVFISNDFGETVNGIMYDFAVSWTISTDMTGKYVLIGTVTQTNNNDNNNTYLSIDFGNTWTLQNTPGINTGNIATYVKISRNGKRLFSSNSTGLYTLQQTIPTPCFLEDSKILCKINDIEEYIAIQNIRKGTLVKTLRDDYKPVDMIGYTKIDNKGVRDRIKNQLYVCSQEKYPELLEDLVITGSHSILVDAFQDEEQKEMVIKREGKIHMTDDKYRLPACLDDRANVYTKIGIFNIYHIALENTKYHANYGIYANGLLVESCSKRALSKMILL